MPNRLIEDSMYQELGRNYRFLLGWRYAVVLAIAVVDIAAFQLAYRGYVAEDGLWIAAFLSAALILLLFFELRTTSIYRAVQNTASRMELAANKSGYYTLLEAQKASRCPHVRKGRLKYHVRRCIRSWLEIFSLLSDIVKPTHTGMSIWFVFVSLVFVWFIQFNHTEVPKASTLESSEIRECLNRVENKLDLILSREVPTAYDSLAPEMNNAKQRAIQQSSTRPDCSSKKKHTTGECE